LAGQQVELGDFVDPDRYLTDTLDRSPDTIIPVASVIRGPKDTAY
jgi:hypothetical protein